MKLIHYAVAFATSLSYSGFVYSQSNLDIQQLDDGYLLQSKDGLKRKISAYGDSIIRVQTVNEGETFLPDNHYEMVEHHEWPNTLKLIEKKGQYTLTTGSISISINPDDLALSFSDSQQDKTLLKERGAPKASGNVKKVSFDADANEHFTGLGHGYYGRAESLDLKGLTVERNYGKEQIEQAPLVVPFYMSSKGYGIFLNSMFPNSFTFAKNDDYSFEIDDLGFGGQLDYFYIGGSSLKKVLNNYTMLTGRPRLPLKSMFGLQLSDKSHDHDSATPSDVNWWKEKITEHRKANYPLDHVINDNRWRAAGGKRCESKIEWDKERYPAPDSYKEWLDENGLVLTLDFNRCIAQFSDGWKPSFNLPETGKIDFKESAPDLTNPEFRQWFWDIFYKKALDPSLGFPGEALWIDEFDEQGAAPKEMILSNGRSSAEMRNYWFFLIAKALVQQGWDKSDIEKRPFVWVRGMTAGAQRYATLWSGDIYPNYPEMEGQIRGMQLAGLSGFPYWGHDAGGFFDWKENVGPDSKMYNQWAVAFGSFAPIWKPHGMGQSRWPLDRTAHERDVFNRYAKLRYELMPYTYTAAHEAAESGIPITRAMVLDNQTDPLAWKYDLQYMWGDSILVAPLAADSGEKEVWLPNGDWYEYGKNKKLEGNRVVKLTVENGQQPMFVKAGAIIAKRDYAVSTAFIDKSHLVLDVYLGASGTFNLIEDDDTTEAYQKDGAMMETSIALSNDKSVLEISKAVGNYENAPSSRSYHINLVGTSPITTLTVNGKKHGFSFENGVITTRIDTTSIQKDLIIRWQ